MGREEKRREGMEQGRGKGDRGMGGKGQNMGCVGWNGEGRERKMRKEDRGYSPPPNFISWRRC